MDKMSKDKFVFVSDREKEHDVARRSLTYWQDAARRLRKNKLAMIGLVVVFLIILFGVFGPLFTGYLYSDQVNDHKNLPPRLELYEIEPETFVFLSGDYYLFVVEDDGNMIRLEEFVEEEEDEGPAADSDKVLSPSEMRKLREEEEAKVENIYEKVYTFNGEKIVLDYSNRAHSEEQSEYDFAFTYKDNTVTKSAKTVANKKYLFGTDNLGRDLLTRVMYGARISLAVAFIAACVNFLIGVIYGAIAGFSGGRTDNIMMRIVDVINSVPLVLYIILLGVMLPDMPGFWRIIVSIGTVYWVNMARLVRGQMLQLKEQEFVLAARALGVKKAKIIGRHLIPNAIGPIIVSMTMMIPSAIFTESFLSFIGLGVDAPQASWGTLANAALSSLLAYPYQLLFPAFAIAITMLAFNFLGDGLRDALDPRLRKG